MTSGSSNSFLRRTFLRAACAVGALSMAGPASVTAGAEPREGDDEKYRSLYDPDSDAVRNYYRVNRYPD
jgi:hypothetical protein